MEFAKPDSLYAQLMKLKRNELTGKELVHALITDDWGPPPTGIKIEGTLADGTKVDEYIPYE